LLQNNDNLTILNKKQNGGIIMWNIIIGIVFIIGGISGKLVLRGTNSSFALVVVGIILVGVGIYKFTNNEGDETVVEAKKEECKVSEEKMIVYNKSHESTGILEELEIGTKLLIDFRGEFGRFYQVEFGNSQIGYILKNSKFSK
jgi:hypothetical protein